VLDTIASTDCDNPLRGDAKTYRTSQKSLTVAVKGLIVNSSREKTCALRQKAFSAVFLAIIAISAAVNNFVSLNNLNQSFSQKSNPRNI